MTYSFIIKPPMPPMPINGFGAADLISLCGVKRNRLQSWIERGWITPSIQKASGSGTRNIFSKKDLIIITLFKKAVESGLSREKVAQLVSGIKDVIPGSLKELGIVEGADGFKKTASPSFVCFTRKEGKVADVAFIAYDQEQQLNFTIAPKEELSEVDDILAINISKIAVEMVTLLEKYFTGDPNMASDSLD